MLIALDLENVLADLPASAVDVGTLKTQTPKPATLEIMKRLTESGHAVVIYTTKDPSLMADIENWLQKNKVPYHHVVYGYPKRDIYVTKNSFTLTTVENAVQQIKSMGGFLK